MDEYFECFLQEMGPVSDRGYVPPSAIERYRSRLPNQLLAYWAEYGWCGYADGLFWTVDPTAYEPVVDAWLGDTPFMEHDAYHIVARSAFGHLQFWGERTGFTLEVFAPAAYAIPHAQSFDNANLDLATKAFFSTQNKAHFDFSNLFLPAIGRLGRLKPGEMYGFEPALALGGPATLDHLHKVKAVEHLVVLAQLAPLRVMNVSL